MDAGGTSGAPEILVLPLWRWRAGLHRRAVRVDGGHSSRGGDSTAVAATPGTGSGHRPSAVDHITAEIRDEDDPHSAALRRPAATPYFGLVSMYFFAAFTAIPPPGTNIPMASAPISNRNA